MAPPQAAGDQSVDYIESGALSSVSCVDFLLEEGNLGHVFLEICKIVILFFKIYFIFKLCVDMYM